jgi:murein DD-endopeptidase MepM/ murein hydrolase activator NlpD
MILLLGVMLPVASLGGSDSQALSTTVIGLTVSGNVWDDTGQDGAKSPWEGDYAGNATVSLAGAASKLTTTDEDGNYSFTRLGTGDYTVTLNVPPRGWTATTTNPVNITIGASTPSTIVNFGIRAPYVVGGFVWIDSNENGAGYIGGLEGEVGYGGAQVRVLLPDGSLFGSAITEPTMGLYLIGVVSGPGDSPADYIACLTVPLGYRMSALSNSGKNEVPVYVPPSASANFGIVPISAGTFTISGNVWVDSNTNSAKDSGEGNYPNATITLSGNLCKTTTTETAGNYWFTDLPDGNYVVTLTVPPGYTQTTTNPVNVTIGPSTEVNFGVVTPYCYPRELCAEVKPADFIITLPWGSVSQELTRSVLAGYGPDGGSLSHEHTGGVKITNDHYALDFGLSSSDDVRAVASGTVQWAGWFGQSSKWTCFGKSVSIAHDGAGRSYTSFYAHMSLIDPSVESGKYVKQGDVIGKAGNTGNGASWEIGRTSGTCPTFGDHLHWALYHNANAPKNSPPYGGQAVIPELFRGVVDYFNIGADQLLTARKGS